MDSRLHVFEVHMKTIKTSNRSVKSANRSKGSTPQIKTFPHRLKIRRILSSGAHIGQRTTSEYKQLDSAETPTQYAYDRSVHAAADTARTGVNTAKGVVRGGKKVVQKAREHHIKKLDRDIKTRQPVGNKSVQQPSTSYRAGQQQAVRTAQRNAHIRSAIKSTARAASNVQKAAKDAAKTSRAAVKNSKRAVNMTARTIKTTAKASVKTAQATAKTTKFAAQAAAKAAQTAKMVLKTIVAGVKLMIKAAVAAAKALVVAVKALIALLVAGGWVVVLVVIVIALVAWLVGSAFGIFFTEDNETGALSQAVVEIQTEYTDGIQAEIDRLSTSGQYDAIEVHYDGDYDGDSLMINNWNDVLAVYAVRMMGEGEEVLTITPEKQTKLDSVFNDMNPIAYRTEVETQTSYDEDDNEVTTYILHIHVDISSMDYHEGAALYSFDTEQILLLEEMMSKDFYELYAQILQVDVYSGGSYSELLQRVNELPAGAKGSAIVQGAAKRIGTPYSTLDCSKLVQTIYAEVGISLPRTSVEQAKYCYNNGYSISASQVQPGDLIFWSKSTCKCGRWNEVHHVGIYIGNGQIIDASSAKGRVVLRDVWSGATYKIIMYARLS